MSAEQVAATPKSSPILPARATEHRLAFVPKDFDDAWRQADLLSKVGIFPDYLKGKPHDILCTIITGAELGLSPMQSVRDIVVVKGKGFIQSKLRVALVKQATNKAAGEFFRMVESTASRAIFETFREGEGLTRYEYTMDMARTAGRADQDNYRKDPAGMLRARCSGDLADIVWPDVVRGIGIKEDLNEKEVIALNVAPATFAPPPPEKPEEAQVVAPTPPPMTPKQAFDQAKNEQDIKGVPPATPPKRESKLKIQDVPTPEREPGSDDGEETPPATEKQGELKVEPPSDLAIFAEVKALTSKEDVTEADLDALSPKAKTVQGPIRKEIADMFLAARARLNKKRTGGK